jgi:carbonic anhydrase
VEYAVDHLHADTVIVMGHTCCGAVNAALHGEFEGAVGVITRRIKEAIGDEKEPSKACELNVRKSVAILREKLDKKDLTVTGAIYDIVSGEVEFLGE